MDNNQNLTDNITNILDQETAAIAQCLKDCLPSREGILQRLLIQPVLRNCFIPLMISKERYYDRLHKSTVRDALKAPFKEAIQRLKNAERFGDFAPSFCANRQNISDSVIDWFCEQSFGYWKMWSEVTERPQRLATALNRLSLCNCK